MHEVITYRRPRRYEDGTYRIALVRDSHGGRTFIYAERADISDGEPVSGSVVDETGEGDMTMAARWPWSFDGTTLHLDTTVEMMVGPALRSALRSAGARP